MASLDVLYIFQRATKCGNVELYWSVIPPTAAICRLQKTLAPTDSNLKERNHSTLFSRNTKSIFFFESFGVGK